MSQVISADCPIVVIKVGGSILKNPEAYGNTARFVANRHLASPDERLVVVVSAQEGVTDRLAALARQITLQLNPLTLDLLWSIGETQSVATLALHLHALGVSAAALNVHETGLRIDRSERNARFPSSEVRLNPGRLRAVLAHHPIAIVPGFFAVDAAGAIVSLGRGGSDLTAVLLATGLDAARCELVKDVPGYFTCDPHRDSAARHLPCLTFEQALALADDGCDLVQRQAIEAAAQYGLPLVIRSLDDTAPFSLLASQLCPASAREGFSTEARVS